MMNTLKKVWCFLKDKILTWQFIYYSSCSFLIAWLGDAFELDGEGLGFGPAWLQNSFEIAFMTATFFIYYAVILLVAGAPVAFWLKRYWYENIIIKDAQEKAIVRFCLPYGFLLTLILTVETKTGVNLVWLFVPSP